MSSDLEAISAPPALLPPIFFVVNLRIDFSVGVGATVGATGRVPGSDEDNVARSAVDNTCSLCL